MKKQVKPVDWIGIQTGTKSANCSDKLNTFQFIANTSQYLSATNSADCIYKWSSQSRCLSTHLMIDAPSTSYPCRLLSFPRLLLVGIKLMAKLHVCINEHWAPMNCRIFCHRERMEWMICASFNWPFTSLHWYVVLRYLHHHLSTANGGLLSEERIRIVWAIMRLRHPLLASSVERGPSGEMHDWQFWCVLKTLNYILWIDVATFWLAILHHFHWMMHWMKLVHLSSFLLVKQKEVRRLNPLCVALVLKAVELISNYLNGPRQLSQRRLSKLIISTPPQLRTNGSTSFDFLLTATHFIGDGMALHTFANDFWSLVGQCYGDENRPMSIHELRGCLQKELIKHLRVRCKSIDSRKLMYND